jgi:RimJ/RimL family protein N-acetyltransferase
MLSSDEVARFISPPPTSIECFRRFITWTQQERAEGRYVCFGIVPHGTEHAVGLFQMRRLEPSFRTAEWGFILAAPFWSNGMFVESANLVATFAFRIVNVHRLEARASEQNGRGNRALEKIGAVPEAILRRSFCRNGRYHEQFLWTLIADEWLSRNAEGSLTGTSHPL